MCLEKLINKADNLFVFDLKFKYYRFSTHGVVYKPLPKLSFFNVFRHQTKIVYNKAYFFDYDKSLSFLYHSSMSKLKNFNIKPFYADYFNLKSKSKYDDFCFNLFVYGNSNFFKKKSNLFFDKGLDCDISNGVLLKADKSFGIKVFQRKYFFETFFLNKLSDINLDSEIKFFKNINELKLLSDLSLNLCNNFFELKFINSNLNLKNFFFNFLYSISEHIIKFVVFSVLKYIKEKIIKNKNIGFLFFNPFFLTKNNSKVLKKPFSLRKDIYDEQDLDFDVIFNLWNYNNVLRFIYKLNKDKEKDKDKEKEKDKDKDKDKKYSKKIKWFKINKVLFFLNSQLLSNSYHTFTRSFIIVFLKRYKFLIVRLLKLLNFLLLIDKFIKKISIKYILFYKKICNVFLLLKTFKNYSILYKRLFNLHLLKYKEELFVNYKFYFKSIKLKLNKLKLKYKKIKSILKFKNLRKKVTKKNINHFIYKLKKGIKTPNFNIFYENYFKTEKSEKLFWFLYFNQIKKGFFFWLKYFKIINKVLEHSNWTDLEKLKRINVLSYFSIYSIYKDRNHSRHFITHFYYNNLTYLKYKKKQRLFFFFNQFNQFKSLNNFISFNEKRYFWFKYYMDLNSYSVYKQFRYNARKLKSKSKLIYDNFFLLEDKIYIIDESDLKLITEEENRIYTPLFQKKENLFKGLNLKYSFFYDLFFFVKKFEFLFFFKFLLYNFKFKKDLIKLLYLKVLYLEKNEKKN